MFVSTVEGKYVRNASIPEICSSQWALYQIVPCPRFIRIYIQMHRGLTLIVCDFSSACRHAWHDEVVFHEQRKSSWNQVRWLRQSASSRTVTLPQQSNKEERKGRWARKQTSMLLLMCLLERRCARRCLLIVRLSQRVLCSFLRSSFVCHVMIFVCHWRPRTTQTTRYLPL